MQVRYVAIWFTNLAADHAIRRSPQLNNVPFVLATPVRGRVIVCCASMAAEKCGIVAGMVVADCRAIMPELEVIDLVTGIEEKLLTALAGWCIRFTPVVAVDMPDGLIFDATGCAHLWGGEEQYVKAISNKLKAFGYNIRMAMADTVGAAWAMARYGKADSIVPAGAHMHAMLSLPPAALRLDAMVVQRLHKLGLNNIGSFITMPRSALRRRFGNDLLVKLSMALGQQKEVLKPVLPLEPYVERLPCLEPIRTAEGIEIAIRKLLEALCVQLENNGLGLRKCVLKCYRIDGNIQQAEIGTVQASRNVEHLFRLLQLKIVTLTPDLGFELFLLEAKVTEEITAAQSMLWEKADHSSIVVAELLDKVAGKVGADSIVRFIPDEHYWPERSYKRAASLTNIESCNWRSNVPRPLHLLDKPEPIEVTVPIPDYPPMLFHYKGALHNVKRADGPERIEQEWWLSKGVYRDYYCVEDERGARFWLFRSGEYSKGNVQWYMHGFFA